MAPPGISNCFDYLVTSTFSSSFTPASTTLKIVSFSSVQSSPVAAHPRVSMCAAHTDHDYVLKPQMDYVGCADGNLPVDYDGSGCGGDAMLSSCALDLDKGTGDSADMDFLNDLGDLNFSFDDLNPCCEVAMEDSFQDFIDSALEQSYSAYLHDLSADNETSSSSSPDVMILSKDLFLAALELRPAQDNSKSSNVLSLSSTPVDAGCCSDSATRSSSVSVAQTTDSSTPEVYTNDSSSNDKVPTRQCSCVGFVSESKAVYSQAHSTNQESVMTCSSTSTFNKGADCSECSQTGLSSEVRMSPLFVDTVSGAISCSFQLSQKDGVDIAMEEDALQRTDRDTAGIMTWLTDSQQVFRQQYGHTNSINPEHRQDFTAGTELSNQNTTITSSMDLETFADLEDVEVVATDKEPHTHTCQKPENPSNCFSNFPCISLLKLSAFTERVNAIDELTQSFCSYTYPESSELLSPNSSYVAHSDFSPTLSISDSNQSPFSPHQLRSMDLSFSLNYEDAIYDTAVKSPLALLNLFSDENAASLLHADSTVPCFRFM